MNSKDSIAATTRSSVNSLRDWSEVHYREDCSNLTGHHENALFHECTFEKLNELTLKDCVLSQSKFTTKRLKDARGFTLTLDCHSFDGVEFSPKLFDSLLVLLLKSRGNDERRAQIFRLLGKDRIAQILRELSQLDYEG